MKIICAHCGNEIDKPTGYVNRARKLGVPQYCNKLCAGFGRRKNYTIEQKKQIKRDYDKEYRIKNAELVRERQIKYNESPAGRAMQKRFRDKRKDYHKKYIQSDKYRLGYKKQYDKVYHAKYNFGEFYEAAIILNQIEDIILPERFEVKMQKGLINKSQKRKRLWNSLQKI